MNHKLDTDQAVYFYENEFYVLSNFSAFNLRWRRHLFPTSEHCYHWERFASPETEFIAEKILRANSAHDAMKIAHEYKAVQLRDWDTIKAGVMKGILWAKVDQHLYVRRKLLETGDRQLIEDSWRDSWWGWGEDRHGLNTLGNLWMEIRAELRKERAWPSKESSQKDAR